MKKLLITILTVKLIVCLYEKLFITIYNIVCLLKNLVVLVLFCLLN